MEDDCLGDSSNTQQANSYNGNDLGLFFFRHTIDAFAEETVDPSIRPVAKLQKKQRKRRMSRLTIFICKNFMNSI